jgi:hypothetical protein
MWLQPYILTSDSWLLTSDSWLLTPALLHHSALIISFAGSNSLIIR